MEAYPGKGGRFHPSLFTHITIPLPAAGRIALSGTHIPYFTIFRYLCTFTSAYIYYSMDFKLDKGSTGMVSDGCDKVQNTKLNTYNWLCGVPGADTATDFVEVQFKNTRKGYYLNSVHIPLKKGDVVAVEASPGHDIGTVTLTGKLVLMQMHKNNYRHDAEPKKVYRKARPIDIEKYEEAKAKEHATMIRSRQIAASLKLNMKIGDVEYQGDGNKAIFYYIADERVDFRQLIKVLADAFHVRIEMKQIGARQEAGRIGGIGPCGRELCCASWMTSFVSVSTSAARYQDVSMSPQKLAGQCAKLKCCLNYEIDAYVEASKRLPSREVRLETKDKTYYHFKTDILSGMVSYSTEKSIPINLVTIPARRAFDIINMNKRGEKPDSLEHDVVSGNGGQGSKDLAAQDNVERFDGKGRRRRKKDAQQAAQPKNDAQPQQEKEQPKQPKQPKAQKEQPKQPKQPKPQQQPKGSEPQDANARPAQPKKRKKPKADAAKDAKPEGGKEVKPEATKESKPDNSKEAKADA